MLSAAQIISIVVFVAVMALVVSEKIHRALAALLGAVVLLVIGIIDFNAGMESIDFNTLGVLCGMMMFVAIVKESGLFEFVAIKSAKACKGNPWLIMIAFAVITAVFSAFLDNVTTVLLIGPTTIMLCKTLDINPVPFLLVEIMMSNIGGTATLIGDPPNIMIGSEAGLSFAQFIMVNAPIVVVIMVVLLVIFRFMYGRHLAVDEKNRLNIMELSAEDAIIDKALFHKSVVMIVLVAIAFMLHGVFNLETSVIALTAAAVIILISGRDIEVAIEGIEWGPVYGCWWNGAHWSYRDARERHRGCNGRKRCSHDDCHPVGFGNSLFHSRQHPVCRNDDSHHHGDGGVGHRCISPLVGSLARRVPWRKWNSGWCISQCGPFGNCEQGGLQHHVHELYEGCIPLDAGHCCFVDNLSADFVLAGWE